MAGTLNTNGAVISGTTVYFENFDVIRYSAAQALAAVSLRVTSGGFLDLSAELNFAPVNIVAFSGGSSLVTGSGNDTLTGGAGNDTLDGGAGIDVFRGGAGNDTYIVTNGDLFYENAGQGTDTVFCPVSFTLPVNFENVVMTGLSSSVFGNGGNNFVIGDTGSNLIEGASGNDTLDGLSGADILRGGAGNDILRATSFLDQFDGGDGVDTLDFSGSTGNLIVEGSVIYDLANSSRQSTFAGIERFVLGNSDDGFDGRGFGSVTVLGGSGTDGIFTGAGNDRIEGGDGIDSLWGGSGNDTILGGAGNDAIVASTSTIANMNGGAGMDEVQISGIGYSRVTLDVAASIERVYMTGPSLAPMFGTAGNDVYNLSGVTEFSRVTSVELLAGDDRYTGAIAAELVFAGIGNDTMNGGTGNDLLYGQNDSDTINGQAGNDFLSGGNGADTFLFNTAPNASTNVDVIADYSAADDTIALENAVFTALPTGVLRAQDFVIGAAAANAAQNVIYNPANGDLFYDPDGFGGAAQVRIANVDGGIPLTTADFLIV